MKRVLAVISIVLLGMAALTSCNKPKTTAEAISAGSYDWEQARELCTVDIAVALNTSLSGDEATYATTRNEWLPRIRPEAQGLMFPRKGPSQGLSSTVTYIGYSGTEFNSEGTEYLTYTASCLDNKTLEKVEYEIVVELERGSEGYIVAGFSRRS